MAMETGQSTADIAEELNDSVWEFCAPNGIPEEEIIFFHGLQVDNFEQAFWKTWVAKNDDKLVWPKEWLSKKFEKARILSVTYNSSASQSSGHSTSDMYRLGENLVTDIILDAECDIGQKCPVVLIGHCLGGIVIKQFIMSAFNMMFKMDNELDKRKIKRIRTFLNNFKGAFFYATPHGGSEEITRFAQQLDNASPVLELLKTLSTETARINEEFRMHRKNLKARTYGIGESLPTTTSGFNAVIVTEASARHDLDGYYTYQKADHFAVCKATTMRDATVIGKLNQFINETLEDTLAITQNQPVEMELT
ncbi:unnamed protein product [Calypogeia fissa]